MIFFRLVKLIVGKDEKSLLTKGGISMINFTWNVFRQTGSVDTYLLFKELERQNEGQSEVIKEEYEEVEIPIN